MSRRGLTEKEIQRQIEYLQAYLDYERRREKIDYHDAARPRGVLTEADRRFLTVSGWGENHTRQGVADCRERIAQRIVNSIGDFALLSELEPIRWVEKPADEDIDEAIDYLESMKRSM